MSVLRRLLRALGYTRPERLTFELDQALVQSLQELSEQEQRPVGEGDGQDDDEEGETVFHAALSGFVASGYPNGRGSGRR